MLFLHFDVVCFVDPQARLKPGERRMFDATKRNILIAKGVGALMVTPAALGLAYRYAQSSARVDQPHRPPNAAPLVYSPPGGMHC